MVRLRRISVEQYRERRLFSWSNCVAAVSGLVRSWQDPCAETRRGGVPVVVGRIARGYATEWPGDAPASSLSEPWETSPLPSQSRPVTNAKSCRACWQRCFWPSKV